MGKVWDIIEEKLSVCNQIQYYLCIFCRWFAFTRFGNKNNEFCSYYYASNEMFYGVSPETDGTDSETERLN